MQSSIVHKLLSLLTTISEAQTPLTFSEIVERTGLNKSTIHRLLSIGVEERVLRFDGHKKVYLLGPRLFDLVRNADKGYDIQAIALDEMVQLSQRYDARPPARRCWRFTPPPCWHPSWTATPLRGSPTVP